MISHSAAAVSPLMRARSAEALIESVSASAESATTAALSGARTGAAVHALRSRAIARVTLRLVDPRALAVKVAALTLCVFTG